MEDDEELELLRRKRLQELQMEHELSEQEKHAQDDQMVELEAQRKMLLRKILTVDARERLGRLKLAHPEFASAVEQQLLMLAQSGRLGDKINDQMLQQILMKLKPAKKEITIKRR